MNTSSDQCCMHCKPAGWSDVARVCVITISHLCLDDVTPVWHYSACTNSTMSLMTEQKSGNDRFLFHLRNSLKWKTKLVAASSPISKSFGETTALRCQWDSTTCRGRVRVKSSKWPVACQSHIQPAVIRSNNGVFVVGLDVVGLQELVKTTLGVL